MSDTKDQSLYDAAPLPWSTFLLNLLLGRQRATPPEQVPLPQGRLEGIANFATSGGTEGNNTQNRIDAVTQQSGLVGRMLTDKEREALNNMIIELLKRSQ